MSTFRKNGGLSLCQGSDFLYLFEKVLKALIRLSLSTLVEHVSMFERRLRQSS
jgi:hypothetical protein